MIEVGGYADSTGSDAKNFQLSRQRAEAVIQYLGGESQDSTPPLRVADGLWRDVSGSG
jgi:outer membrane protein OmpA-like peptidoglycan-associated protein